MVVKWLCVCVSIVVISSRRHIIIIIIITCSWRSHFQLSLSFCLLGAFRVEMQRDTHQPRTIACRYDPTEPGTYVVQVLWSAAHVPGSPFVVHICPSRSELDRVTSSDQSQLDGSRAVSRQTSMRALHWLDWLIRRSLSLWTTQTNISQRFARFAVTFTLTISRGPRMLERGRITVSGGHTRMEFPVGITR